MAPRVPRTKIKSDPNVEYNIRQINKIRKELGKPALPIKNNKWYEVVESYSTRYANSEMAIKMIASSITPYQANKFNRQNANTSKSELTRRVNTQYGRFTLDEVIRTNSIAAFESNQVEQFNASQEYLMDTGQLDVGDASTTLMETDLRKGQRKRK